MILCSFIFDGTYRIPEKPFINRIPTPKISQIQGSKGASLYKLLIIKRYPRLQTTNGSKLDGRIEISNKIKRYAKIYGI